MTKGLAGRIYVTQGSVERAHEHKYNVEMEQESQMDLVDKAWACVFL